MYGETDILNITEDLKNMIVELNKESVKWVYII